MTTADADLPIARLDRGRSLRETVTESLRAAVVAGDLKEGTLYSAPALAAAFGVSATPVREAMMDLTREGLVTTVKNKGFRVVPVTEKDLDDITEIRLLIEPPATAKAVAHVSREGIGELRSVADEIVAAARGQDLAGYLAADRKFHNRVLTFLGNAQLADLATSLRIRTRMYGLKTLIEHNLLEGSAQEHHELLDLIEQQDADGVLQLMRRHIGHARGLWATGKQETAIPPRGKA